MPAFREEYQQEENNMLHQSFQDWRERVLRNEEPFSKIKEQKEAEERDRDKACLESFIKMAHDNPEWHLKYMAKELEHETFCLINKMKYEPGFKGGVPGFWEFRQKHGQQWILNKRERLPNE